MTVDIERFTASDYAFAIRFPHGDLPGLLSKTLEVPDNTYALIRREGGNTSALGPGGVTAEFETASLVKDQCTVSLEFDAGRSQDNLAFEVSVELDVRTGDSTIDLSQFESSLLKDGSTVNRRQIVAFFEPYVHDAVKFFVHERTAKELATQDQRQPISDYLQSQLKKPLFESGMRLHDVLHPTFTSGSFDAKLEANAEADAAAEAIEREKELLELKKNLDRHALLMDIELHDEADRNRKEKRLERYEQIRTKMGDNDVKALIMMLDNDQQRATLIRELIEKDLSPDQRAKIKVSEMEGRVEERLVELQQKLAQLTGAELEARDTDPITRRVVCVVGKRLMCFDPKTNLHPEVPKEVHDTEGGGLGYLRSVRNEVIDGEDYLLAGAQRGVYKINGHIRTEFTFPKEPQGKGGANSVCYFDGRIYATHSEVGLMEWTLAAGSDSGRMICEEYINKANAVRGATVHNGHLFFSAGTDIYSLDLATGSETPTRFKGSDDSVTSFTVVGDELVAGNRSGKLYRWSLNDPNSPQAFGVVRKNPIFMLRHASIAGQLFYLIGSKEFTVTAAEPKKDVYREYQAREEVRWVDAAADFVFGVSRSGYKVFCWDAHRQSEPKLTIRVSDKVQDLFVIKMLPQKA